jgi:proteasome lid subunit RPN8/RPN11
MREHSEGGYPAEVCGLLVGRVEGGAGSRQVVEARATANLNRERPEDRYEMSPRDFLAVERDARARSLEVVGVYHSHPDHPSIPSETDRVRAEEIWQSAESWSYLILEIAAGRLRSRRSWVLKQGVFAEEEIRLLDPGP